MQLIDFCGFLDEKTSLKQLSVVPMFIILLAVHTVTYLPYSINPGKKLMSKVIQKSEVLNMRCTNVREYCKYYLKY